MWAVIIKQQLAAFLLQIWHKSLSPHQTSAVWYLLGVHCVSRPVPGIEGETDVNKLRSLPLRVPWDLMCGAHASIYSAGDRGWIRQVSTSRNLQCKMGGLCGSSLHRKMRGAFTTETFCFLGTWYISSWGSGSCVGPFGWESHGLNGWKWDQEIMFCIM